ncbi:MAG: SRPBCC family protein [Rhodobacteraceae bacterium]|nr:SRPBCC family protein [Paracoccaceae bacterium]MCY4195516.1 SRPBCC family protein [Paracoccaceae bacterium]
MGLTWIFVAVAALLASATSLFLIPATTRSTVEIRYDAPIEAVWDVYRDVESQPNWRTDVAAVKMADDKRNWTEEIKMPRMTIRFRILEDIPPMRLVLQTGADGNFSGQYIAEFKQENGGTVGTFTEEVTSLGFMPKVMRRLFFNPRKFIEEYAKEAKAEIERQATHADHR